MIEPMEPVAPPKPRLHPLAVFALVLVALAFALVIYVVIVMQRVTDDVSHELGKEAGSAMERGADETIKALQTVK